MDKRITGVVPIVLTPLKKNGDIDTQSCERLVDYLIENGAAALFALGSASEGYLLDNKQRLEAVSAFAKAARKRVPLIVGCSHLSPRNVFEFLKQIKTIGVDGVHYIPEDLKLGDDRLVHLVKSYAEKSPVPLYLYHNTKRGKKITLKVVKALKPHPNIRGIKVGGYDREEMKAFLEVEDDGFQILGSGGGQFLDWLQLGASAVTASSACCFPILFQKIYNEYLNGDLLAAEEHQTKWNEFHSAIPNTASENGEYAAEEKYVLRQLGVIKEDHCHFPLRSLSAMEKQQVNFALKKYCKLLYS
ncbi:MAG: dihydrodipicolinate synthase family protein [Desulfobacter sp.]